MLVKNYSKEILISAKPQKVYKAITMNIDKWWTESSNQAMQTGDPLVVRFEKNTSWVMTISEAVTLPFFAIHHKLPRLSDL